MRQLLPPLALAAAILATHAACGKGDPAPPGGAGVAGDEDPGDDALSAAPRLGQIQIADMTPEPLRLDGVGEQVEASIPQAFHGDRAFVAAEPDDETACQAGVQVGYALTVNGKPVAEADAGEARAMLEAEVFCPTLPSDANTFRVAVNEEAPFGGDAPDGKAQLTRLVATLATRAAENLRGQHEMREANDARVLRALAADDHPGILAEAASEAGERRLQAAVPDLARLTAHEEPLVSVRAGAALGQLRARSEDVVRALVKMTQGPSVERHIVAIHALGDIGGPDAARYLENLAVGHPEAGIRELARETAERARKSSGEGKDGAE